MTRTKPLDRVRFSGPDMGARLGRAMMGVIVPLVLAITSACSAQDLNRQVNDAIDHAKLSGAKIGVCLIDLETGRELAGVRATDYFIPASNMKLLTSGAALSVLGAGYEFMTQLERFGDRLVIRGAGDPALADPAILKEMGMSVDELIDRLAASVERSGMKAVSEIVIDDRVFDREYVHSEWPRNQLDKSYCAEVCGLNFHANVLELFAAPSGRDGDPATIRSDPRTAAIEVRNKARTTRAGDGSTRIGAVRQGDQNTFTITGTVSASMREPAQTTLHEASLVMGRMLAERLGERLITVGDGRGVAGESLVRLAGPEEEFDHPTDVLAVVRTPMSVVLRRCNGDSENLYAESLAKLIGHVSTGLPGTWGSGTSAVRVQIRNRLGPEFAAAAVITDGSGLSRTNRVTPRLLASWLSACARDSQIGSAFVDSLPRAGVEGTMANRFRANNVKNEVRGKSGYINQVRTLSGYVTHSDSGRRVAFSILINDIPGTGDAAAKDLHEKIVQIADQWLTKQTRGAGERERIGG
ncbi:MAG: D-alanyl-D-alanine carboxypeptidase/D-alanyl-D-alanine-endopeptidase [Phycisphaerales bacterium]